ncbi:MAG: helix-turn-helix transcriptional regulator [Bacilli bacterium]
MLDNNLKYCREELEMTQEELGYVFGVSRQTVTGWETNQDPIPLPKLVKFSNMYKYSLDYITGLTRKNDNFKEIGKLDKKQVGASLKDIRLKLGLTQQQLADECMITQATYSGYENGKYLITSFSLYTICYKHNLSIYDVLK